MTERDLKRDLLRVPIDGEHEARVRAWELVRTAYEARGAVTRRRRHLRPLAAVAVAGAAVAAALSPAGSAVLDSFREAVGVERARPALFSLPAPGRLLVVSPTGGTWVVQADGSKRRLGRYADASWSPFGRFVVVSRANELVALEPDGDVRWTLARPRVRRPVWGGSRTDTRIAYLSAQSLRVVAGDGTGDRLLIEAPDLTRTPFAWRPGSTHALAFATQRILFVVDAQTGGEELWSARVDPPRALAWSSDGRRVLGLSARTLALFDASGRRLRRQRLPRGALGIAAAFQPRSHRFALLLHYPAADRSELRVGGRQVFAGAGRFTGVEWSPDGRWLLVAWQSADQLLFVRSVGVQRIVAVSNVSRQFAPGSARPAFPTIGGWCCAS